ncbi:MAG: flagellar motor switch protein FliG [Spirochaetales bacterium]
MHRNRRASEAYKRGASGKPQSEQNSGDATRERAAFEKLVENEQESAGHADAEDSTRSEAARGPRKAIEAFAKTISGPKGAERAARLLLSMGAEQAARVLAALDEPHVEAITAEILKIGPVRRSELIPREQEPVTASTPVGGAETAREMLIAAFGEEEGERRFFRLIPNAPERHFAFLNDLQPPQLSAALRNESPQVAALVLTHVSPELAAGTFASLSSELQAEVARRIARMGSLSRSTVVAVEEALKTKIRQLAQSKTESSGGSGTLAAILRHMNPSTGESLLEELSGEDPELGRAVKDQLYTVDLLEQLRSRDLSALLREFSEREIALFLKGKSETLRARVLREMSERRAADVSEEYAHLGPRRREDVDEITREVLKRLKELEESGSILVPREGDRYI